MSLAQELDTVVICISLLSEKLCPPVAQLLPAGLSVGHWAVGVEIHILKENQYYLNKTLQKAYERSFSLHLQMIWSSAPAHLLLMFCYSWLYCYCGTFPANQHICEAYSRRSILGCTSLPLYLGYSMSTKNNNSSSIMWVAQKHKLPLLVLSDL